jgi:hypothetical protein
MTAVLLLALAAQKPEAENYFKTAKVGDWIEHKTGTVVMRHTVSAKPDDAVTLRIDQTVDGRGASRSSRRSTSRHPRRSRTPTPGPRRWTRAKRR